MDGAELRRKVLEHYTVWPGHPFPKQAGVDPDDVGVAEIELYSVGLIYWEPKTFLASHFLAETCGDGGARNGWVATYEAQVLVEFLSPKRRPDGQLSEMPADEKPAALVRLAQGALCLSPGPARPIEQSSVGARAKEMAQRWAE